MNHSSRYHRFHGRRIVITAILSLVVILNIAGSASTVADVVASIRTIRALPGNRDKTGTTGFSPKRRVASALFESPCDVVFV